LNERLVPVVLEGVVMRQVDELEHFWMSLREQGGMRQLRILIGPQEAAAISMGAQRVRMPRPMTHDTLKQAVDALGGRPARIEIRYQPGDSVFTADLLVEREAGDPVNVDCRPSDAVALAVRYEPPPEMLVVDSLLEEPAAAEN
jgi:bifunctional DNase/RNase